MGRWRRAASLGGGRWVEEGCILTGWAVGGGGHRVLRDSCFFVICRLPDIGILINGCFFILFVLSPHTLLGLFVYS